MTNYANWWAYYRTRMQTMKTATSLSFEPIGSRFRVGYMTINNNTSTDFQNIDVFNAAQKKAWYDKLFSAVPNLNTPLRVALSNAGRLYAGRLNET
jgi:type IV pilus assembly protein PilY1